MDLRGRLMKVVNRDGYLGPWRLAVMRVVDPVEWYMRSHDGENLRPVRGGVGHPHRGGWTAYVPVGDESPDPERQRRALEELERRRDAAHRVREALTDQYAAFFEGKARELLKHNEVRIDAEGVWVRAKLIHFRNGAVFEHGGSFPGQTGHGMTRIGPSQLANAVPLLARYLKNAVLGHGHESGPLR